MGNDVNPRIINGSYLWLKSDTRSVYFIIKINSVCGAFFAEAQKNTFALYCTILDLLYNKNQIT